MTSKNDEIYLEIDTLVEKLPKTKEYIRKLERRSKGLEEKNIDLERQLTEERRTTANQAGLLLELQTGHQDNTGALNDDVIQDANRRIDELDQGLKSISTLVSDSKKNIESYLEEQHHQLENSWRSETSKSKLIEDSINLSLIKLQDLDQQQKVLQQKITKINKDCAFKRNQKSDLEESLATTNSELAELQREHDTVDAKKAELEDALSTANENDGRENLIRCLQKRLTRYEYEKRQLKRRLANQREEAKERQRSLSETSSTLEKLEDEKSNYQDQKRKLEEKQSLETQSNEHRKTQLSTTKETMRNLSSDSLKLNAKKEEFDERFSNKDEDFRQIKVTLRHVIEVIHTTDAKRLELERKTEMLEEQLKIKTDAAQVIKLSLENVNAELKKLKKQYDMLQEKHKQRKENMPAVERSLTQFQNLLIQSLSAKTAEMMTMTSQEIQRFVEQECQKETKQILHMYIHDGNFVESNSGEERLRHSADSTPDGSICSEDAE